MLDWMTDWKLTGKRQSFSRRAGLALASSFGVAVSYAAASYLQDALRVSLRFGVGFQLSLIERFSGCRHAGVTLAPGLLNEDLERLTKRRTFTREGLIEF